jgi:hypothetical protein
VSSLIGDSTAWVQVSPDANGFAAKTRAAVDTAVRGISPTITPTLNAAPATAKITALNGLLKTLSAKSNNINLGVNDKATIASLARIDATVAALQSKMNAGGKLNISDAGLARMQAQAAGADASLDKLITTLDRTAASTDATASSADNAVRHYGVFGTVMDKLSGSVSLYGGALDAVAPKIMTEVGGWHLLGEAAIETVTIWGLAAVAVGAFSIAAAPAIKSVVTQFMDMHTASTVLNTDIPGLSGNFSEMAASVKPEVYTLLGEGLLVAQHSTGTFGAVATSTGNALDRLGARVVAALTSATSSGKLAKAASTDVSMLGTAIGDLVGIIGSLVKDTPGYAAILLKLGTSVLGLTESFVNAASPILKVGLAAHGAIIYLGLLSTGISKLVGGGLGLISGLAEKGALALGNLGLGETAAAKGIAAFADGTKALQGISWGWITIAVGLFAYLADKEATAADATERWVQAQQQAVLQAGLSSVLSQNGAALAATTIQLATATATYEKSVGGATSAQAASNKAMQEAPALINPVTGSFSALGNSVVKAQSNVTELTDAQKGFQAQGALVQSRLNGLAQQFGGTSSAMALMNAAGITTANITDKNNSNWQQSVIMMEAQEAGFQEMKLGAGRYGAVMQALSNPLSTYDAEMGKVTQAQSTMMSTLTGGETGFATFAQGLNTLKSDADHGKVSISGLGSAALGMSQDFYSNVNAAESLIGSLENQGVSTKNLTKATATMAGQMLAYAGNNTAAQATVISLINSAVGPGTVSFKNLNTWVAHNSTSMAGFQNIVGQATVAAAGMAGGIDGLTKNLFEEYLTTSSQVTPALKNYANSIVNSGTASSQTAAARQQLIKDFERAGLTAQQANTQVNNLTQGLDNLPKNTTANIEAQLKGTGQIKATDSIMGGSTNLGELNFARGGVIPGASSNGHDNHLVSVKSGELIVPSQHAARFGVMAKAAGIPGFAGGGVVGSFGTTTSALNNLGPMAGNASAQFAQSATTAFVKALQSQMSKTATGGGGSSPAGVATSSTVQGWIEKALQIDHAPSTWLNAMEKLVSLESGGNPTAVDPILVGGENATGIAQMLQSTFNANALPGYGNIDNGLDNLVASVRYIQARYGSPMAIPGIGNSAHYVGYSAGGVAPEGIIGKGMTSGNTYGISTGEYIGPLVGNSTAAYNSAGDTQMTNILLRQQNDLIAKQNKLLAAQPQMYANGLNGAVSRGARSSYFATGG